MTEPESPMNYSVASLSGMGGGGGGDVPSSPGAQSLATQLDYRALGIRAESVPSEVPGDAARTPLPSSPGCHRSNP